MNNRVAFRGKVDYLFRFDQGNIGNDLVILENDYLVLLLVVRAVDLEGWGCWSWRGGAAGVGAGGLDYRRLPRRCRLRDWTAADLRWSWRSGTAVAAMLSMEKKDIELELSEFWSLWRAGESTEDQEDGGGDDHDSEDHVDDGHSGGARDGEGPSDQRQFVYVNSDNEVTITSAGAGLITPAFYERTDTTGMSWGKVSTTTKEFYYREFKKNARVDPSIDEGRLRKAFLKKAAEWFTNFTYNQKNPGRLKKKKMDPRPFEQLKKVWEEDPEFLKLSKTKKKNRRKGKEDGPALGTYCGG
ncbi:unnamed protein product [Cuscuta campestris]|uniref:Uncharacterized protein n=1 Tax=Cuscuta campestris TaxID=132261 RepID=A0A484K191_9ASTE|nr:unnamed protein product [Cuscuta campestris]